MAPPVPRVKSAAIYVLSDPSSTYVAVPASASGRRADEIGMFLEIISGGAIHPSPDIFLTLKRTGEVVAALTSHAIVYGGIQLLRLPDGAFPDGEPLVDYFPDTILWQHHFQCAVFRRMRGVGEIDYEQCDPDVDSDELRQTVLDMEAELESLDAGLPVVLRKAIATAVGTRCVPDLGAFRLMSGGCTLIQVARQLDIDIAYQAFELDRIAVEGIRVATDIEHVETVARLLLGPLALNSSLGGFHHIVNLSGATMDCIGKLGESWRPAAELLAGNGGRDPAKDKRFRDEVHNAYAVTMPVEFRQVMSNKVFALAIEQSCEIETWYGVVPSAILAKDITLEAFKKAIPFYSVESPGRGPHLIAEAERHILGEIISNSQDRRIFRGPFRDL
ncbi:hypothetical protein HDU86_004710 [Geranomyces michiganensis]|nr:hypothetical protein HDU86_004710 [Geranomyces michiganensis]